MRKKILITATLSALFLPTCASVRGGSAIVDLCAIANSPAKYVGQIIVITGAVESDGMHFVQLESKECPHQSVALLASDEAMTSSPDLKKFWSDIFFTGTPGTIEKEMHGTFVGKVGVDRESGRATIYLSNVLRYDIQSR